MFSDEFEVPGRTIDPGDDDPYWEAEDLGYDANLVITDTTQRNLISMATSNQYRLGTL